MGNKNAKPQTMVPIPENIDPQIPENLLIKFKHLLKSDDVEDYIAEITTEENGKVTEKPKRIKIGDFKKLSDA